MDMARQELISDKMKELLKDAQKVSDLYSKLLDPKYLVKDMHGKVLYEGDKIQGFNNRKYAADKSKLYETGIMEVTYPSIWRLVYGDTFEYDKYSGQGWFWKIESTGK